MFMFMGLGSNCKLCKDTDKMVNTAIHKVKLLVVIIPSKLKFDKHALKQTEILVLFPEWLRELINLNANCFIILLLCQTSGILLSFGCSVQKLLIKKLAGFINEHLAS